MKREHHMPREVTDLEMKTYLKMFSPETHSLEIRGAMKKALLDNEYVAWVPPIFGSNHQYHITEAGMQFRSEP